MKHTYSNRKNGSKQPSKQTQKPASQLWLYGNHACIAALHNPERKKLGLALTSHALKELENQNINEKSLGITPRIVTTRELDELLPPGAVHQGIAFHTSPLPDYNLESFVKQRGNPSPLLMLDQVTDPHNIGAMLRSAAAFGVGAVIVTDRHSPQETGVMAKSASGAMEVTPLIRVSNLVQSIEMLKKHGYWSIGLDGYAEHTVEKATEFDKAVIVMGAEGSGLRRLTREHCDVLVKLPMTDAVESLNVSNAAAITLYEIFKHKHPNA